MPAKRNREESDNISLEKELLSQPFVFMGKSPGYPQP